MKSQDKVILTCAITGAAHMPCMSPYLPVNPDQIIEQSVAAAKAGASMIHLHARDPHDGFPTTDPDVYGQFLPQIKQQCDAIINITTGQPSRKGLETGDMSGAFEERMSAPLKYAPEVTSFNMGSLNIGLFSLKDKLIDKVIHDWERQFLEKTKGITMVNNYETMEYTARELGDKRGVKFEFECFDIGHLYALKFIADQGWVKPPFFIQTIFGFMGGLGASPKHVMHMKQTADDLFGDDYYWSVVAAGKAQIPLVTMAAVMGANVRVGMEDSLWYGPGELATSNAQQVGRIKRILEELSIEVATPDEARQMLGTKGADNVNF